MKQLLFISTFFFFICCTFAHNWLPAGDAILMIEDQKLKVTSDKKEEGANRFFDSEPGVYYKVYLDVLAENTDVIVSIISQPTTGTGAVLKKEEVKYGKAELFFQAITDNTLVSVRRDNKDEDGETIFFIEHIKVSFIKEKEAEEPALETKITHIIGEKKYELTDHLGNVKVVLSDKKKGGDLDNDGTVDYYRADVVSAADYYPFGLVMPGRSFNSNIYRFGFNGKEKDDEVKGSGNTYDYGFRIYDPRIGRFLSIDPLARAYPWNTPYSYAENDVIRNIDLDGLEKFNMTVNKNDDGTVDGVIVLTSLDVSKGLQVSINGAPPISNFKYQKIQDALGKVTVGRSPSSGENALLLNGKEISKGNTAFSARSSGSDVPEFSSHFSSISGDKVPSEREGIVTVPSFFFGSATGNIYKDNNSTDFNPVINKGQELINGVINTVNAYKDQENTTIKITIGGGANVGVDVKKSRGEAIQKQIIDAGFKGKFEIDIKGDKDVNINIQAVEGE